MKVLAIDPGNIQSAFVVWDTQHQSITNKGIILNEQFMGMLADFRTYKWYPLYVVIEKVACMGMAVGETVFETVFWTGRFAQVFDGNVQRITRREVKLHLCGNMQAKDGNIRQALIDRLGPVGTKKAPGRLYGVSKDIWAALAVAVTWSDKIERNKWETGLKQIQKDGQAN